MDLKLFLHRMALQLSYLLGLALFLWQLTQGNFKFAFASILISFLPGMGVTVVLHRYLSHRSFALSPFAQKVAAFLATITLQSSTIVWVATHRTHHAFSDLKKDPHSPLFLSRWRIQFFPYFAKIRPEAAVDLMKDPVHLFFHQWYWMVNIAWFTGIYLFFGIYGLGLWFSAIGYCSFWTHSVNSMCHRTPSWLPSIDKNDQDESHNVPILYFPTFGEAYHGNHHRNPRSYRFGRWDFGALIIEGLARLKIAQERHLSKFHSVD